MKKTLVSIMSLFFAGVAFAQVEDISITVAPSVGYTWWDNNTTIKDGMMVRGQVGFGFGRGIELRGVYEQSVDLKSAVSEITNEKSLIDKFESRDVKVTRWGGEFKANLPTGGWLAPYLTLGSGVQTLKVGKNGNDKQEQIYASAGLGTKFNISDRVTFNVEGRASAFNMDPSNVLYDRSGSASSNVINNWINKNTSEKNMINWSVMAGLQFYLGGRTPEEMNAVEQAYNRQFGGGLKGFKFVIEPSIAYVNFDNKINLRDSYFVGGAVGFDFTEYVGIRGFYYQASKDEKISNDWDKMALYGGDFLARLNVARGVVPYITVGGGYLNVYDSYKGKNVILGGKSGYFAKGGVGLSAPLGKFIEVYGSANMLLTTDNSNNPSTVATTLKSPDQLRKNIMYTGGFRIKLGAEADGNDALKTYIDRQEDKRIEEKNRRIAQLEKELKEAYKNNDAEKAVEIIKEKQKVEQESVKVVSSESKEDDKVRMSPEQLQTLVNEVINDVDKNQYKGRDTEQRIDYLERLLLEVNTNNRQQIQPAYQVPQQQNDVSNQILEELKKLNDKVERNSMEIESINKGTQQSGKTVVVTGGTTMPVASASVPVQKVVENPSTQEVGVVRSVFLYKGLSVYTGANFGDVTTGVFGLKAHYEFTNSSIEFVPDLMLGFGSETAYGLNANVLFPFNFEKGIVNKPYVGVGLGLNNFSGDFNFGPNIIVGTSFNVLNGQLYVDYTSRNLFDNNQIAVGYRFGF